MHNFKMHKRITTFLIFLYIVCYTECRDNETENGGHHRFRFHISLGRHGGSEGDANNSHNRGLGISSILKSIFSLPISVPRNAISYTRDVAKNIIRLNFHAVRLPVTAVGNVANFVWVRIKGGIAGALNIVLKLNYYNAEAIAGMVRRIQGVTAWVIRGVASTNIAGIKTASGVGNWFRQRGEGIIDSVLKLNIGILADIGKVWDGSLNVLHLKQILHLPEVKQIQDIIQRGQHWYTDVLYNRAADFTNFTDSIINQHKDFFTPIFHRELNVILTLADALRHLQDGKTLAALDSLLSGSGGGSGSFNDTGSYTGEGDDGSSGEGDDRSSGEGDDGSSGEGDNGSSGERDNGSSGEGDDGSSGEGNGGGVGEFSGGTSINLTGGYDDDFSSRNDEPTSSNGTGLSLDDLLSASSTTENTVQARSNQDEDDRGPVVFGNLTQN